MRSFLQVAARSLHQRAVRLRDTALERASLFPFFDRHGRVLALMLVWPPLRNLVLLKLEANLVRVPWVGEIEIRSTLAELRDVDLDLASAHAGLWHYDPWWVLRDRRFTGHPAVPVLKATNCAGRLLKLVHGCYFTRDLSRLEGVSVTSKKPSGLAALDRTFIRFTPELLPEKPEPVRPEPIRRDWKLDPFWLRDEWRLRA